MLILIRTLLTIFSGGGGSGGSEGGSGQEGTQGMISNLRISSKSSDFIAISWDIKGRYGTIITCFLLIVFLAFFFKEFRNWFDTSFLFIRFIVFFVKVMIEMFSFLLKYRSTFIFFDIGHNPNFSLSVHLPVRRWTSFTERRLHLSGTPLP